MSSSPTARLDCWLMLGLTDMARWLPQVANERARRTGTVHMRRSMQLDALEAMFEAVPSDATTDAYRRAVLDDNVLGQATASGRLSCWKPMRTLYRLDPSYTPFALLRQLWNDDRSARPR